MLDLPDFTYEGITFTFTETKSQGIVNQTIYWANVTIKDNKEKIIFLLNSSKVKKQFHHKLENHILKNNLKFRLLGFHCGMNIFLETSKCGIGFVPNTYGKRESFP